MEDTRFLAAIPDDELLRRLAELLQASRRVESDLIAHIAEVDERRLYAREAAPSMFAYCTQVLHLSEAEAYLRITVARASREHPVLLTLLGDGSLHLTAIAMLAPHLTPGCRDSLLRRATHRSKRQIEELIAEIGPRPDAPASIRKLPDRQAPEPALQLVRGEGGTWVLELRPDGAGQGDGVGIGAPELGAERCAASPTSVSDSAATQPAGGSTGGESIVEFEPEGIGRPKRVATIQPLGNARYKVQFTASAQFCEKLERLRALLRSDIPDGDLARLFEQVVTEKLERIEARRFAKTSRARTSLAGTQTKPCSRHIPAAVRRIVRERDGSRCGYFDESGRRCSERERLEYHHRHPFGMGGDHSPNNIQLVCRTHNDYLAVQDYGREAMSRHRHSIETTPRTVNGAATGPTVPPPRSPAPGT